MQSVYPTPALWAQLLTALMIGLLTTVAFQLLLTSLGIALGISVLSLSPTSEETTVDVKDFTATVEPKSEPLLQINSIVGLSVVSTVNLGLFAACFMAAKFSQLSGPVEGAIAGVTIWAAYLLLVLWVSVQTVNTVVSFLLDQATGGLRRVVGAIAHLFQRAESAPIPVDNVMDSVRQEIQTVFQSSELRTLIKEQLQSITQASSPADPTPTVAPEPSVPAFSTQSLWEQISTYLAQADTGSLTAKRVDRQLQKILYSYRITALDRVPLTSQDIKTLRQGLDQRGDLSEKRKQRILSQIAESWQQLQEDLQEEFPQASEPPETESAESVSPSLATTLLSSAADVALEQVVETVVDTIRDGSLRPLESVQSAIAHQVDTLQTQVQSQAEATRRSALKAAWWLFVTIFTGAISAALAGALATGLRLPSLVNL
ncbi:MAG TPA: hypothetical protein V6D07_17395 [Trichocoleus sp.]